MSHLHSPSRRLPCGCRVKIPEPTPGDRLTKTCRCGLTYAGTVRERVVISTALVIDWIPGTRTTPTQSS